MLKISFPEILFKVKISPTDPLRQNNTAIIHV